MPCIPDWLDVTEDLYALKHAGGAGREGGDATGEEAGLGHRCQVPQSEMELQQKDFEFVCLSELRRLIYQQANKALGGGGDHQ